MKTKEHTKQLIQSYAHCIV